MSTTTRLLGAWALLVMTACASTGQPPLQAIDSKVDIERFMGDWYVIGSIPIDIPLLPMFSEKDAHNAVESYRLTPEGVIETTYTFRKGAFDGPEKRFTPKGRVYNQETNAEWRMQFFWPFESAYLIIYLDKNYQETIIGVPDRKYVWIMARKPQMTAARYDKLIKVVAEAGYDVGAVRRVPQRWDQAPAD